MMVFNNMMTLWKLRRLLCLGCPLSVRRVKIGDPTFDSPLQAGDVGTSDNRLDPCHCAMDYDNDCKR